MNQLDQIDIGVVADNAIFKESPHRETSVAVQ